MKRTTIPNKGQVLKKLTTLVQELAGYVGLPAYFALSGVRNDGTVVVRFKSTDFEAAITVTDRVALGLLRREHSFTQIDDVRLVVPLHQFTVERPDDQAQG